MTGNNRSIVGETRLAAIVTMLVSVGLLLLSLALQQQTSNHWRWTDHTYQVRDTLSRLERDFLATESGQRVYVHTGDGRFLNDYETALKGLTVTSELRQLVLDNSSQTQSLDELELVITQKRDFMSQAIQLRREGNEKALMAHILSGEGLRAGQKVRSLVDRMLATEAVLLDKRKDALTQARSLLNYTLLGGLVLLLILGPFQVWLLDQRLRPLLACERFADAIARGDLTAQPLAIERVDEVGRVATNLNTMLSNLREFARQSRHSADSLNSATAQMAAATRQQAMSLQQQSTAMQQSSVTLEELSQSAAQIADRSREVASRAEITHSTARRGEDAVDKTVIATRSLVDQVQAVSQRIVQLSEKTQAIRDIVLSVNDIAERSNILALNASILAAAAGQEGKSFTVVANEMKNLADQSKESTVMVRGLLGEIESGIQASVGLIEEAVKRGVSGQADVDQAITAIQQLSGQVGEGAQAFQQIVAATNQQRLAFEQVNEALASIRQATHQSAATIQQLEGATGDLHRLSGTLVKSLENYRLESGYSS